MSERWAGTGTLLRTFLRRDRWMLLWWTLGVTLLYYSQAVSVDGLYATQADFDRAAARLEGNSALIAMTGPARALNTVGGQVTWQAAAFGAIVVGLMSMFIVGRHTRAEEESGRDELLRASPVGRRAPLTAALLDAMVANTVIGAAVALSLVSYGLAPADSVGLGVGLTLCGWVFTGTASIAAQLTSTTRSMYGVAGAVIGLAYGLRAVGDVGDETLSWLTPIGWYQRMYAFSGLRWWPAMLLVAAGAATLVAAYTLFGRRDFGAGMLAARPGPARAQRWLGTPWGLAWRLQRGSVLGWTLGLLLCGLAYGSLGDGVGDVVGDSSTSKDLFLGSGDDLVKGFYATSILMLGLLAAGFAVSSALRPRGEEEAGRVELLLATALPRRAWLLAHVAVTALGSVLVVGAAGLGLGVGYALSAGDGGAVGTYFVQTLPTVAPVLVLAGLTRLLVGLVPRAARLAWLGLGFVVVVLFFGALFRMPPWLQGLSPFHHLAQVPAEDFRWAPVLVLLLVATLLSVAGQLAFLRRDVR